MTCCSCCCLRFQLLQLWRKLFVTLKLITLKKLLWHSFVVVVVEIIVLHVVVGVFVIVIDDWCLHQSINRFNLVLTTVNLISSLPPPLTSAPPSPLRPSTHACIQSVDRQLLMGREQVTDPIIIICVVEFRWGVAIFRRATICLFSNGIHDSWSIFLTLAKVATEQCTNSRSHSLSNLRWFDLLNAVNTDNSSVIVGMVDRCG